MKLKLKTAPYPHQLEAIKRAVKKGNYCFFFEPRCGKSKAALDTLAVQYHRGQVQKVVVFAPLIALNVWVDQITEHCAVPWIVHVVGEHGNIKGGGKRQGKPRLSFFLINYDKFSRRGADEVYSNDYRAAVESWRPDCIVLDESHRVKSSGAVRSQAIWRMVRKLRAKRSGGLPFVFLLTGTPNPKGYIDLFSQFRILDDSIFGTNKADFEDRYVVKGVGRYRYRIIRYRNVGTIKKKIKAHATVVSAEKAGLSGVRYFNPIRISLPEGIRTKYEQLADQLITEIEGNTIEAANAGVRRLRLLQLTGGFTTDGVCLHDVKLKATTDYLTDLCEQDESVVVYARFLPEVHALTSICERVGYKTNAIYGGVKRADRAEYIKSFQRGSTPSALVFQADAGSLAIELTAAAEEFFYSLPDSWETFFQCLERVKGPKQKRPVRYTFLVARNTVDVSVLESLREKRDMHRSMMGNPRRFLYGL